MKFRRAFTLQILLAWAMLMPAVASAQVFPGLPAGSPAPASPFSIRQEGIYTTAPITLDGSVLFRIAALANQSPDQLPIPLRQSYIQSALAQVVATTGSGSATRTIYDPKSLNVQIKQEKSQATLQVVDATHRDPLPIVTVTSVDARYHQLTVPELASQWQAILQGALEQALLKRQPAVQRESIETIAQVGAGLVLFTLVWAAVVAVLRKRIARLEEELISRGRALANAQSGSTAAAQPEKHRRRFLARALRTIPPSQQLALYSGIVGVLLWSLLLIWLGAITWALSLFPQTTPLAHDVARNAIAVATIWIVAGLLDRVLDIVITRSATTWRAGVFTTAEERARQMLRAPTIARALSGFKRFSIVFLAALFTLSQVGIPVGSVVTIGGVAAIAVTLAAQNFVRDFIGGFLVLFEDQYVVGDFITINGRSGLVEHFNLRIVQIRDSAGNLITIPHSAVQMVINESRYWSRIDYRVSVDPAADISKAIDLIREAIDSLSKDEKWRDAIIEPVEWIGVDSISRDFVVIRASIKTAPLRQFDLRRELNARVQAAFVKEDIKFGAPLPDNVLVT
ncbi:MAG: mechanosensitive ion channel family protein [Vulcanimicrobiaceae bacterium]